MNPVRVISVLLALILMGCEAQNPEHYPDAYNKEVDRTFYNTLFPKQHNYAFATGGNSVFLASICPKVVKEDKYITISYELEKDLDPKDIALLNVFMHKKECKNDTCEWKPVSDTYYLPNGYANKTRIKNFFPKGEYRMWYGFYLKKDSLQEYPKFYKTTCYLTID